MDNTENKKKTSSAYKIIIGLQLVIIIVLAWLLFTTKSNIDTVVIEKEKTMMMNEELQSDLDSLMSDYDIMKEEYGYLTDQFTEQDSLIMAQAKEIEMLINSQADYRRIKRKLDYLREITQGYVNQIDSLYRINQTLTSENQNLKGDLENANQISSDLTQDKDNLTQQLNDASYMKAYSISATAYKVRSGSKESATDKARKVDKIRVCMVVGENALITAGQKDIYVRIARPDNLILTQGSYSFVYQGQRIQYSAKTVINYDKKAMNVCIDFTRGSLELPKGKYHIAVLCSDNELGQTTITLR